MIQKPKIAELRSRIHRKWFHFKHWRRTFALVYIMQSNLVTLCSEQLCRQFIYYMKTRSDIVSLNHNTTVWHVTDNGSNPGNLQPRCKVVALCQTGSKSCNRNAKVLTYSQIHAHTLCTGVYAQRYWTVVSSFCNRKSFKISLGQGLRYTSNVSLVRTHNRICITTSNLALKKLVILNVFSNENTLCELLLVQLQTNVLKLDSNNYKGHKKCPESTIQRLFGILETLPYRLS